MVLRILAGSFKWTFLAPLFKFATVVVASDVMARKQRWGKRTRKL